MAYYPDVQYVDKSQPYFWGHENDPKDGNPPYGWYGQYLQDNGCPHIANVGTEDCWTNTPENAAILAQYPYLMGQPKWYYAIDAYDVGPAIDFNTGAQIMDPATGNTVPYFYRHYTPDWTGPARPINAPTMGTGQFDLPEQLKYANPPDDKTLLAYCTWHQATATSGRITAVSMSGTAKQFTYRQVLQLTANLYNPGIH